MDLKLKLILLNLLHRQCTYTNLATPNLSCKKLLEFGLEICFSPNIHRIFLCQYAHSRNDVSENLKADYHPQKNF